MKQMLAVKSKPTHFDIISDDLGGGESHENYLETFMVDSQEVVGGNTIEESEEAGGQVEAKDDGPDVSSGKWVEYLRKNIRL